MMLIEADKREEKFALKLTYAEDEEDRFYVPSNLYIIGTMNTADRSLAIVDYALRRRFAFITLQPDYGDNFRSFLAAKGLTAAMVEHICSSVIKVNGKIKEDINLGEGFQIGHSYFCTFVTDEDENKWWNEILSFELKPLLEEIWFDDSAKVVDMLKQLSRYVMQIPIENIYYLLCYAWNKLDEKERVNVSVDDKTELLDLFAKVLINATKMLLKRDIDKNYVDHTEELPGVKGKIQISQTLKSNLLFRQRTVCTFDDFSVNIISNRILVSTIYRLTRTKALDKQLRNELVSLQRMLSEIEQIEITNSIFKQVKLNRNNRFYGFVMNVCQIIYESTFPSEEQGKYKFSDFTRDDNKMNQLFESFIRNFYKIEQQKYKTVKKETINWQFENSDNDNYQYLPQMETDITLENDNEKIIIDAKFYRETMALNYDKKKIKSANLYQLFSYLLNQQGTDLKTQSTTGILLYPTIETDYNLNFKYNGHKIQIRTINLNSNWKNISSRLKKIIEVEMEAAIAPV